jgi:hypothetical protein
MKRAHFLIALFLGFATISQGQEAPEQALIKIENQLLEAIGNRNHDALNSFFDDSFHGVLASGQTVNKTRILEFLETSSPHILLSLDDLKSTVYGTTAIVTGKVISKSKSGTTIAQSRFIRIYLKKGDAWKIIESQGTVIIQE